MLDQRKTQISHCSLMMGQWHIERPEERRRSIPWAPAFRRAVKPTGRYVWQNLHFIIDHLPTASGGVCMGRINLARVLIGGFVAGLIINFGEFILNGVLIAEEMNAAMAALNKPPVDPSMIIWFVLFSFGFAFILVWTYAAIRPRFGPGVKTAVAGAWAYTEA
jgi:hypothetical protein